MGPILVFVEFADEAKAFIRFRESHPEAFPPGTPILAVAMSLSALLELKRAKIPYQNTLPYFTNDSHADVLVRSEEWLSEIERINDGHRWIVSEAVYAFRFLANYLLWATEIVINATDMEKPAALSAPAANCPDPDPDYRPGDNYRPLGMLVRLMAQKAGIPFYEFPVQTSGTGLSTANEPENGTKELNAAGKKPLLYSLYQRIIRKITGNRRVFLAGSSAYSLGDKVADVSRKLGETVPLALDGGAGSSSFLSMIQCLLRLRRHGGQKMVRIPIRAFPCDVSFTAPLLRQAEHVFLFIEKLRDADPDGLFHYRGMDLSFAISGKLKLGLRSHLRNILLLTGRIKTILEWFNPTLILSPYSAFETAGLGVLAQEKNIPALLVPHGSLAAPRNRLEEMAWKRLSSGQMLGFYRWRAAQTPLAAAHARYFNISPNTIPTGSLIWADLNREEGMTLREKLGISPQTEVMVYAAAQRKRTSLQFQIFETEDEYLEAMTDLVHAVNRLENTHLIIKLHPSSEFSETDMRLFLPHCGRMSVLHREPFYQVLSAADLLVSFISTTVEEAAMNRIPVVLYDRRRRYCHGEALDCDQREDGAWPVSAVYYTGDNRKLPQVIRFALDKRQIAAGNPAIFEPYMFKPGETVSAATLAERLLNGISPNQTA